MTDRPRWKTGPAKPRGAWGAQPCSRLLQHCDEREHRVATDRAHDRVRVLRVRLVAPAHDDGHLLVEWGRRERRADTELADKLVHHRGELKTVVDTIRIVCTNVEADLASILSEKLQRP
jgi:hypothetical protein